MTLLQIFLHLLYTLDHSTVGCTDYNIVSGYGPNVPNVIPSPPPEHVVVVYGGNCLQAFLTWLQHGAQYFRIDTGVVTG